tara:strand:- start:34 stop:168 length:135 start_codon:yes stop_codon:yes gene_type:complete
VVNHLCHHVEVKKGKIVNGKKNTLQFTNNFQTVFVGRSILLKAQ